MMEKSSLMEWASVPQQVCMTTVDNFEHVHIVLFWLLFFML